MPFQYEDPSETLSAPPPNEPIFDKKPRRNEAEPESLASDPPPISSPSATFIQDEPNQGKFIDTDQIKLEAPFYFKPSRMVQDIDYNMVYTKNTFISASRALSDYLITYDDLDGMRTTAVRTAYSVSDLPPDHCYLKLDVEKRALERWGSLDALEREKERRQAAMEEGEKYRKGLSALIGHLKKTVKDQSKKEEENKNKHS